MTPETLISRIKRPSRAALEQKGCERLWGTLCIIKSTIYRRGLKVFTGRLILCYSPNSSDFSYSPVFLRYRVGNRTLALDFSSALLQSGTVSLV
ncbi:hypothetical protein J6590_054315 [Homalodisca vitripennis]|nr:hypothetical protein J6590_054315 [Homalodisca vitripennis]